MSEYKEKHICIIDFKSGNIASISNVLEKLKVNYCISNKNEDIEKATHLILPGVGSFAVAMTKCMTGNNTMLKQQTGSVPAGKVPATSGLVHATSGIVPATWSAHQKISN